MEFLVDLITVRWRRRDFDEAKLIHPATQSKLLQLNTDMIRTRAAG